MTSSFFKTDDFIYKPKEGFSGNFGTDSFGYGSDKKTAGWKGVARFAGDALSSFGGRNRDPFGNSYGRFTPGEFGGGGSGKVTDNLSVIYPQQLGPTFIPGMPGEDSGSIGSRIAGGLGGALSGAATGSTFGPWGTAVGALVGGASGAFG